MSRIAKNEIYFGRDVPLDEVAAAIDAVSHDDVVRVAERLFRPGALALTVLGDLKGEPLDDGVLAGLTPGAVTVRVARVRRDGEALPLPRYMSDGRGRDGPARGRRRATSSSPPASAASCRPGSRSRIPAGLRGAGAAAQRAARRARGSRVLNAPGTIDADYRGEVQVLLVNLGDAPGPHPARRPHRAARGRAGRARRRGSRWRELPPSERGAGGFGSTGTAVRRPDDRALHASGDGTPLDRGERGSGAGSRSSSRFVDVLAERGEVPAEAAQRAPRRAPASTSARMRRSRPR